jgi:putative membrane protein
LRESPLSAPKPPLNSILTPHSLIGREIENPFGSDVNDLPLDSFCEQIRKDIDIIMAKPAPESDDFVLSASNQLLYPLSHMSATGWADKSVEEIREALGQKPKVHFHHTDSEAVERVKHHSEHGHGNGHGNGHGQGHEQATAVV